MSSRSWRSCHIDSYARGSVRPIYLYTALLVPTPTSAIIAAIKTILDGHNPLEEGPGGVYEECERLLGTGADEIVLRLQSAPRVAMAPHVDNFTALESARNALRRAGYDVTV